ncbi:hypothetical protein PHYBLDRAFT_145140 [Phycomyces blakesleeanus NRRL 1555(-)]|uniref:Uncharacterized protein n=1 Tax=Phycomyces blakesleeanus (strain ATCC 8743b / DSM 1359 / FGSC 10004 / NBRC 33097 / NRRL 1555) TaxID=763407 RepID=A0A162XBA1_PHYB8|nr:hypothetical protein PHYBLDRAFT_145128 [Phycomyces blakesleeanus NRRL 1555(-)]XP_018291705.1 hypothetical protein PHYBLDRAFT_145140 [Phycomyces blakesleeanus NRRL 1555(-)]OAD73653.1 hypothetical protein PHYBLDRAFT_145128 [Phycomyces blakesleeanus NRRL 1555(-)]OAD73665.1 hypothetical protein PHYBLDRAFT_145140 [Phycomyces blakesleeanus NRRL 1555(-)]|eukprot:XP_018291693.1 hypothetical protein PHYBLDRAFT_145128 [Phycomyces blakesleeanus NRRL 1555(-)]
MIATSPCVRTQTMRTHACPDIRSYFEMAKPKFICTKGYASMTDQLDSVEFADDFKHHAKPVTKQGELEIVTKKQVTVSNWKCVYSRKQDPSRRAFTQTFSCEGEARLLSMNLSKPSRDNCIQAIVSPSRWVGQKAHEESRLGYGYNKNKFLIIIRDYWLRTAKKVFEMTGFILWAENTSKEQVEAASRLLLSLDFFVRDNINHWSVHPEDKYYLYTTCLEDTRESLGALDFTKRQSCSGSWRGKPRSGSSSAIWWPNPFVVDPIAASWHIVSAGSLVVYCWWSCIPPAGGQGPFRPVIEEHFAVPGPSLQMMLPIPSQVPFLTKQILSIKTSRIPEMVKPRFAFMSKSNSESCPSQSPNVQNYPSVVWVVPPSLKTKSISKKGSNAKFQKQVPKEKSKTKTEAYTKSCKKKQAYTKSSSPKGSKEIRTRGLY